MSEPVRWDTGLVTQAGDPWFESTLSVAAEAIADKAQRLADSHCSTEPLTTVEVVLLIRELATLIRDTELERLNG